MLSIDQLVPDLATPIAYCCTRGNRSCLAAYQLPQLGWGKVASLRGGLEQGDQKQSLPRAMKPGPDHP